MLVNIILSYPPQTLTKPLSWVELIQWKIDVFSVSSAALSSILSGTDVQGPQVRRLLKLLFLTVSIHTVSALDFPSKGSAYYYSLQLYS